MSDSAKDKKKVQTSNKIGSNAGASTTLIERLKLTHNLAISYLHMRATHKEYGDTA
jgi:hypothetical protein